MHAGKEQSSDVILFYGTKGKDKGQLSSKYVLTLSLSLKRFLSEGRQEKGPARGPLAQRWITDSISPVGLYSTFGNSQCSAPIDPSIQFAEILGKEVQ